MAKFRYRMQSILEIKKKLEEQAKNEFAAARAALNEEEDKLEQLKKRKEAYEDEGRALRENTLNIMDIIENKEALLRMDEFIADQQLKVKRAQDRMEEARLALQTAMQESKTQEKLREKAFNSERWRRPWPNPKESALIQATKSPASLSLWRRTRRSC